MIWCAGSGQAKQGRQPTVATWPTAAASFPAASASQASPISHPDLAFPVNPASPVSTCPLGLSDCPTSPVKPIGPGASPSQAAPIGTPVKAPKPTSAATADSEAPAPEQKAPVAMPHSQSVLQTSLAPGSSIRKVADYGKASIAHASDPATSTGAATAGLKTGPDTSPAISSSKEVIAPNKRRKLGTLEPPPGLLLGSRAKQAGQASLLSRQSRMRGSIAKADSEDSDAQSHHDAQGPVADTPTSTDHTASFGRVPAVGDTLSAAQVGAVTATEREAQGGEQHNGKAATARQLGQDAVPAADIPAVSLQTDNTGSNSHKV